MMHTKTVREVKLMRRIISTYHNGSDEHKRSEPMYYKTLGDNQGTPLALDESGEPKLYIIKGLLNQLGLDVKIYTWIGGKVIIDINILSYPIRVE
jgi:hypothetical protein